MSAQTPRARLGAITNQHYYQSTMVLEDECAYMSTRKDISQGSYTNHPTTAKQLCVQKLTAKLEFWHRPRGLHCSAIPATVCM